MARTPNARGPPEQVVKYIRRATRRHFSAEDKIRIVLDGSRELAAPPAWLCLRIARL